MGQRKALGIVRNAVHGWVQGSPAGAQWVGAAAACAVQTLGGGRAESWGGGEDSVTMSDLQ